MKSSHWVRHARKCKPCYQGHPCGRGREILSTRWDRTITPVPVSNAATARVDVRALLIGSAL